MSAPSDFPLVEELIPAPDVVTATRKLQSLPKLLVLDSALQRDPVGRYSFLTADPIQWWQTDQGVFGDDPFRLLESTLNPLANDSVEGLPPFQGGVAGLMGYELGQCFERVPTAADDEFQLPSLAAGLYDWVIAWDHHQQRAWLISQGWPEVEPSRRAAQATRRAQDIRKRLSLDQVSVPASPATILERDQLAPQHKMRANSSLTSNFSRDDYLQAVRRVIEYIHAGDIFQANLTQRLLFPSQIDAATLFERLRQVNPAPFAGLLQWDDWVVISASPERFLRVDGRDVETRPIKGTRRRNRGPEADLFTRDELRESEKDQAENVMIVDLLRNDLSRVCEPGSIRVPQLCGVETYETVQHLVSEVRGRLRSDRSVWDLFRAAWPGGSITGAPKVRAMQIIAELEPTARGPYCGSLFYVGTNGQTDSSLLIRTFVQRKGWLQCGVGGGIVAQSDPAAEYEETLVKAAGMIRALGKISTTD
ncbi:MAG: pabB [Schlesneria sp.]|nr:pabB [Schlesneria sp.]